MKKIDETEYAIDELYVEKNLLYNQSKFIKYLNKIVPKSKVIKKYKIKNYSFYISPTRKLLIVIEIKNESPIIINFENNKVKLYDLPGLMPFGPRYQYEQEFINNIQEFLISTGKLLEYMVKKYNKSIYFGYENENITKLIVESETINTSKNIDLRDIDLKKILYHRKKDFLDYTNINIQQLNMHEYTIYDISFGITHNKKMVIFLHFYSGLAIPVTLDDNKAIANFDRYPFYLDENVIRSICYIIKNIQSNLLYYFSILEKIKENDFEDGLYIYDKESAIERFEYFKKVELYLSYKRKR